MRIVLISLISVFFISSVLLAESVPFSHTPPRIIDASSPATIEIKAPKARAARLLVPSQNGIKVIELSPSGETFKGEIIGNKLIGVSYLFQIKVDKDNVISTQNYQVPNINDEQLAAELKATVAESAELKSSIAELERQKAVFAARQVQKSEETLTREFAESLLKQPSSSGGAQ